MIYAAGGCSLRAAIQQANATAGTDTIAFSVATGLQRLPSALPVVTNPVTIDGGTQPGFTGTPLIVVRGDFMPDFTNVLEVSAGSSTIRGLALINSSGGGDFGAGLRISAPAATQSRATGSA